MFLNKKILCLIPARGGSKGIINKNLKKIKNKSLVKISIDFAKSLRYVDKIVVSSDETKILKEAKLSKVNLHKRSKKLSGSLVSDYEIINEIINNFEGFDYLIYLQPTSPFRKKKSITEMFENLIKTKSHGAWSVTAVDKKFHPKKILTLKDKKYIKTYFKEGEKIIARQQLEEVFIRNGIFYIFSIKELKKQKTIYLKKTIFYKINYEYYNIDVIDDLKNSKKLAKKLGKNF